MDKQKACYCGLYCDNCAVKVKVEPAAKVLYNEMCQLGFADIMSFFPNGEQFWSFLKNISTDGICVSCKVGSGNPACQIRQCAKAKKVDMCALCEQYPCAHFTDFFEGYPMLKHDNALLRDKGWEAWGKHQDARHTEGFGFAYDKKSPK